LHGNLSSPESPLMNRDLIAQLAETSEQNQPPPEMEAAVDAIPNALRNESSAASTVTVPPRAIRLSTKVSLLVSSLTVACIFWVACATLIWLAREKFSGALLQAEPAVVARLGESSECRWASSEAPRSAGDALLAGETLKLDAGVLELELTKGTRIAIHAPAEIGVRSTNGVFLRSGKLVAKVPPSAIGFQVETSQATVVDLGTEFAVEVRPSGATAVSVITGIVDVAPRRAFTESQAKAPASTVRLTAGQGVQVANATGVITPLSQADLRQLADQLPHAIPSVESKPQVLAYFRLGEDDPAASGHAASTCANNTALFDEPLVIQGRLSYTSAVANAHSQKGILFGNSNDRAAMGHCSGFKFSPSQGWVLEAWARPEQISRTACVAYLGEPNSRNGLGIYLLRQQWTVVLEGRRFCLSSQPCQLEQWTHLALVQTRPRQLWLYVNGKSVGEPFTGPVLQPTGSLYVGGTNNAALPDGFTGQIDEVRLTQFDARFGSTFLRKALNEFGRK
jgi:hypothetical protein